MYEIDIYTHASTDLSCLSLSIYLFIYIHGRANREWLCSELSRTFLPLSLFKTDATLSMIRRKRLGARKDSLSSSLGLISLNTLLYFSHSPLAFSDFFLHYSILLSFSLLSCLTFVKTSSPRERERKAETERSAKSLFNSLRTEKRYKRRACVGVFEVILIDSERAKAHQQ